MDATVEIDHFVVGVADLDAGRAWAETALGCGGSAVGQHALMGTHNVLWKLGSAYLELIAIDPRSAPPARARWYGLDDPETQTRIADRPTLLTWLLRTHHIEQQVQSTGADLGPILHMSRGRHYWSLTVPVDGCPLARGTVPGLIEWHRHSPHPTDVLADNDIEVSAFSVRTPYADVLAQLGADTLAETREGEPELSLTLRRAGTDQALTVTS